MTDPYNTTKEQVMIDLLRHGNEDAFRYFYDKYWNVVYHFIRQKCGSPKLAEDGSQEVFHNLWINRSRIWHGIVLKHMLTIACVRTVLAVLKNSASKGVSLTTIYASATKQLIDNSDASTADDIIPRASTTN